MSAEEQNPEVSLSIYKNPELIESVVIFDPLNGPSQKFLDVSYVTAGGMPVSTVSNGRFGISAADGSNVSAENGNFQLEGQDLTKDNLDSYTRVPVCREILGERGEVRNDVRAATNPIQFRFDGVPLLLPRESYIEIGLNLIYLGPTTRIDYGALHSRLDLLRARGWGRTAAGMIQLVQAVDISATSFQVPDTTTQAFLEAVQTKDAEIVLRPDYFFNSYVVGETGISPEKDLLQTPIVPVSAGTTPTGVVYPPINTSQQNLGVVTQSAKLQTGATIPVTLRIPLSAISPVFKVDCLPLFMTNSTNITIQFQVQNPNVCCPLHNPMAGNFDGTTYLDLADPIISAIPQIGRGSVAARGDQVMVFARSPCFGDGSNQMERLATNITDPQLWLLDPSSSKPVTATMGAVSLESTNYLFPQTVIQGQAGAEFPVFVGATMPGIEVVNTGYVSHFDSYIRNANGSFNYLFWKPDFTIRAVLKSYAATYGNPLVSRYLKPYLVGPEEAPAFFRSAFLSYNFNSTTITVPPQSVANFNFNISQTLINVPMAFLMFSEISYSFEYPSTKAIPVLSAFYVPPDNAAPQPGRPDISIQEIGYNFKNLGTAGTKASWVQPSNVPDANRVVNALSGAVDDRYGIPTPKLDTTGFGLLQTLHRSQYFISSSLGIENVQVAIGPSGWNLYQRPLDIPLMNEVTLNTLTRYDNEMVWGARVKDPNRFRQGDAWCAFDLSHDEYRGLFIDADNMLNVTGILRNTTAAAKTVYVQLILPYVDHFIINLADSTVTKSQL